MRVKVNINKFTLGDYFYYIRGNQYIKDNLVVAEAITREHFHRALTVHLTTKN